MIPNPPVLLLLEGKGSWPELQVNTALQPESPAPQEINPSTLLVLVLLSLLVVSASEEGCLAEPAKTVADTAVSELILAIRVVQSQLSPRHTIVPICCQPTRGPGSPGKTDLSLTDDNRVKIKYYLCEMSPLQCVVGQILPVERTS